MHREFKEIEKLFNRIDWGMNEDEFENVTKSIEHEFRYGDSVKKKHILDIGYREFMAQSLVVHWYLSKAYKEGKEKELLQSREDVHHNIWLALMAQGIFFRLLNMQGVSIDHFHGRQYMGQKFEVAVNPAGILRFINIRALRYLPEFRDTFFIDPATPIREETNFYIESGMQPVDDLIYTVKFKIAILSSALTEISKGQDERIVGLCRAMEKDINALIADFDRLEQDFIIFRIKEREGESGDLPELPEVVSAVEEENPTILSQVKTAFCFDIRGLLGAMNELLRIKGQKPENEEELDDQIWVICEALRSKVDDFGGLLDEYLETQAAQDVVDNVGNDQDKV